MATVQVQNIFSYAWTMYGRISSSSLSQIFVPSTASIRIFPQSRKAWTERTEQLFERAKVIKCKGIQT